MSPEIQKRINDLQRQSKDQKDGGIVATCIGVGTTLGAAGGPVGAAVGGGLGAIVGAVITVARS